MNSIQKIVKIYISILLVSLTSCGNELKNGEKNDHKKHAVLCIPSILFKKKMYSKNDAEIASLVDKTLRIDSLISSKKAPIHKKNDSKFGKHQLYSYDEKNIKLINEIYVKDLNLVATKHEIFFIDDCNIIAKMTRYVFLSTRIKSVYYFIYHDKSYVGCITTSKRSLFHKSDKWVNITDEIIAKNWSNRIYNNIIKPYIF